MQLLLASSSFASGGGYLDHCKVAVEEFLAELPDGVVLYVPYGGTQQHWGYYASSGAKFFGSIGQPYTSLHTCGDPVEYIANAKIKLILIGSGNTFLLLKTLQDMGLSDPIRKAVEGGVGFMGTSAGSLIACPTIQTTNDMFIIQPTGLQALKLVNFQINAHFVAGSLMQGHRGETREQRIEEYHELNDLPVIGLSEQSWIRVSNGVATLRGADAVIFERGKAARPWTSNTELEI